jgi:hypothetical protein
MSEAPELQLKLIQARSAAIVSHNTFGKPSNFEFKTKIGAQEKKPLLSLTSPGAPL